jgi:2-polyprenyl-3-methyl-5-hydroxy-6-metoxy-1,4-benzoquinol methylase
MALNARTLVIRSLSPECSERLLDVGSGPLTSDYDYADRVLRVTCVDWNLKASGVIPSNIKCFDGDFTSIDVDSNAYDSIIAADVFEHISLEQEPLFVKKWVSALRPGVVWLSRFHTGEHLHLSIPIKLSLVHRILARLHLYKGIHHGSCDIRKGHKHYVPQELINKFRPLQLSRVAYFGYVFDPLLSWAVALSRGQGEYPAFRGWSEVAAESLIATMEIVRSISRSAIVSPRLANDRWVVELL